MSIHGTFKHRRAARALTHRNPTNVQVLEERFSPTAIFPGMEQPTGIFGPPFPDDDDETVTHRRGHRTRTTEIATIPFPTTPPVPIPQTTSVAPVIVVTLSTSKPIVLPTTSSLVPTTRPIAASANISSATPILSTTPIPSANVSASTSPQPSSGVVNVGAIVGGIGAGIVAVAVIGFVVTFFVRRTRKRAMNETPEFDARDFRRSAFVLHDPPTHEDTTAHGYGSPPSGMEQRQQAPATASAWGYTGSHYGANAAGRGARDYYQDQQPPFTPGQTVSPTSAQPLVPSVAYSGHNPISPVSPLSSPYEQGPVLTRQISANPSLEREPMAGSPGLAHQPSIAPYPTLTRQPTTRSAQVPVDDYVDLNRSSVSPYQAAQYAEISRRLNAEPPSGLSSPAQLFATQQKDLPPVPPPPSQTGTSYYTPATSPSPFADPAPIQPAPLSPKAAVVPTPATSLNVQTLHVAASSTDSMSQEELEFPVPPSPSISYSSRYRVDSTPPMLPQIHIQERSSVSSYINSPLGSGFPSGMTGIGLQARSDQGFISTPSPLASSFGVASPAAAESRFAAAQEQGLREQNIASSSAPVSTGVPVPAKDSKGTENARPNTVYDPEDAYGGI